MTFLKPAGAAIGAFLALVGSALADDKTDITRLLNDTAAQLSACEVDKAANLWSKEGSIFPPAGMNLLTGAEELDRWRKSCAAGEKVQMGLEDLDVSMKDHLAVVTGMNSGTFTPKGGEPREFTYRFTAVMKKEDGKWKACHLHVSAPVQEAAGGEEE